MLCCLMPCFDGHTVDPAALYVGWCQNKQTNKLLGSKHEAEPSFGRGILCASRVLVILVQSRSPEPRLCPHSEGLSPVVSLFSGYTGSVHCGLHNSQTTLNVLISALATSIIILYPELSSFRPPRPSPYHLRSTIIAE
jgi:hypothetical protein